jgi:hypothetical protein
MLLLGIDGVASKRQEDAIRAFFNNYEMETILAALIYQHSRGRTTWCYCQPGVGRSAYPDRKFPDREYPDADRYLGTLFIEGNWDLLKRGLSLDASIKTNKATIYVVDGFIPIGSDHPGYRYPDQQSAVGLGTTFCRIHLHQLSVTVNSATTSPQDICSGNRGMAGINKGIMTVHLPRDYRFRITITIIPGIWAQQSDYKG